MPETPLTPIDRTPDLSVDESDTEHSLSTLAYNAVSNMIRTRRLSGNEVIVEAKLAGLLGVSRTPLREALQRLEGEGLVQKRSNRSFIVRQVDLAEYLHSLKVRELLEPEAAALACGNVDGNRAAPVRHEITSLRSLPHVHTDAHWLSDDSLHDLILDACGNPVLARMVRELRVTTRLFEISKLSDRVVPDLNEHTAILDAIESADPRAARRAMARHLKSLAKHALASVS